MCLYVILLVNIHTKGKQNQGENDGCLWVSYADLIVSRLIFFFYISCSDTTYSP